MIEDLTLKIIFLSIGFHNFYYCFEYSNCVLASLVRIDVNRKFSFLF